MCEHCGTPGLRHEPDAPGPRALGPGATGPNALSPNALSPGSSSPAASDPTAPGPVSAEGNARRRRRLWELDYNLHCSIVGTCLTLGDLRRIAGRLKLTMPAGNADYAVHGTFVRWASRPGPVAKQLQRTLERRHAAAIRVASQASTARELIDFWQRRLDAGDIPGPYWALLTHPAAGLDLVWQAFGDVHMLSHLVGAANHADIRRLKSLERDNDELADALGRAKRRLAEQEADARRLIGAHAAELAALSRQLRDAEITARVAGQPPHPIALPRPSAETSPASPANPVVSRDELHVARREARQQQEIDRLRETLERQDECVRELKAESAALEAALLSALAPEAPLRLDTTAPDASSPIDLSGLRIVYIGGRDSIIPHIRALVERANGAFLHHDGGIEDSGPRLEAVLTQGDAVFCPVDCVSHRACQRAKDVCRQGLKTFVPLRSASLSAIAGGLRALTGTEGGGRPVPEEPR